MPLGSTTQYFKSIDELRREGLAEVARRIECEYDEAFRVTEQGIQNATALADFINEYLSDRQRVHADAALYAAAIEDPEVEDITRSAFESFLRRCEPFMDEQRAKILCAFMEGAIINSCFMGLPLRPRNHPESREPHSGRGSHGQVKPPVQAARSAVGPASLARRAAIPRGIARSRRAVHRA